MAIIERCWKCFFLSFRVAVCGLPFAGHPPAAPPIPRQPAAQRQPKPRQGATIFSGEYWENVEKPSMLSFKICDLVILVVHCINVAEVGLQVLSLSITHKGLLSSVRRCLVLT